MHVQIEKNIHYDHYSTTLQFIERLRNMEHLFAERIKAVPRSFIREILKVSLDPEIISFAGGLPNKKYFPVEAIQKATESVFNGMGNDVLQYSNSEGIIELRELISRRYREKQGLDIAPEAILITNGSQQGLDLLGKALLNPADTVLIEQPGYLGAIQSLSIFEPNFEPVQLTQDGIDIEELKSKSNGANAKMLYTVPNFQNPSGVTYSESTRQQVTEVAKDNGFIVIEDDPYGELRFTGEMRKSIYSYSPENTVLLGTMSKTVAPGFRIGWLVAPEPLYEKLLVAKQASDLHTSSVNQHILAYYLRNNSLDEHLKKIIDAYGGQCKAMASAARRYLPPEVDLWEPEGGMFLWGELPKGWDALKLFDFAVAEKVVFVPGAPFYTDDNGSASFRMSFSCLEPDEIEVGMKRLANAFAKYAEHIAAQPVG